MWVPRINIVAQIHHGQFYLTYQVLEVNKTRFYNDTKAITEIKKLN